MRRPPVYDHPPVKVLGLRLRPALLLALLENLFFGAATVFAFLFAWVVLRQGVSGWANSAYLLVFWAVLAYLALPRLHRVLTAIYVPDYFIGRTRTSDGLLGDPVNLAFTGSGDQIRETMREAGWIEADPVNLTSSVRIVVASLTRRSYARAPVSPLFLFGQQQAFAFQQEVEGNPAQRHHVRFWPCPPGWLLPGGHKVDWIAAGSYDRAVGLSFFTLQVTHRIDADLDIERDYIVDSIRHACPHVPVRTIADFSTGYHSRNGGGDAVRTDGDLPVVDVSAIAPAPQQAATEPQDEDVLHRVGRRPFSVVAAGVLTVLSLLISLGVAIDQLEELLGEVEAELVATDPQATTFVLYTLLAFLVVVYLLMAAMAWLTFLGSRWARLCMLAALTFSQLASLVQYLGRDRPAGLAMLTLTLDLLTIYALTSLSARQWTHEHGLSARRRMRRLIARRERE
ncbi:hypothetical protein BJY21_004058 [Kineosphaera limosa]|uniref:LssY-like C-terminal domain-containing protein n=1 Tax=Kineosphaera limosa NBRC 100340 TaxID=1184609 RepID=K6X697_9MICO|nr:LssY C-terminal domain-containing protein [Kineosphaera limosa]NYE02874.1 hypothetical protein [Kineosphaera limosa]GAB94304.1 hypothetical protein KILIM_004_00960 [Kineosphaera limosa NBRC 100340]